MYKNVIRNTLIMYNLKNDPQRLIFRTLQFIMNLTFGDIILDKGNISKNRRNNENNNATLNCVVIKSPI